MNLSTTLSQWECDTTGQHTHSFYRHDPEEAHNIFTDIPFARTLAYLAAKEFGKCSLLLRSNASSQKSGVPLLKEGGENENLSLNQIPS